MRRRQILLLKCFVRVMVADPAAALLMMPITLREAGKLFKVTNAIFLKHSHAALTGVTCRKRIAGAAKALASQFPARGGCDTLRRGRRGFGFRVADNSCAPAI